MTVTVSTDTPLIRVSDLVILYGTHPAVQGISFSAEAGEHLTLLGPSGCGKTTTLRAIAGLEQPSSGEIELSGQPLFSSVRRINVPTEKRGVSMVFQSYAIWPHMSVFENVAYGLRVRRIDEHKISESVNRALELVQMTNVTHRPASMLSGGQQQRVALARAIAFSPSVVLFDEPLSNLDAKLRGQMRVELRDLQARLQITSIYVTHDQEEALAISDRVIIMNGGKIEQFGTPDDIYNRPRNRFVADFIGSANILEGTLRQFDAEGKFLFEAKDGQLLRGTAPYPVTGKEFEVAIRTAYVHLSEESATAGENQFRGTIRRQMFHGDFIQYIVQWVGGELVVRRSPTEMFDEGANITLSFSSNHCVLLEPPSNA
ncbi:MAG: ABC transporter ATP-binding protein [Burkholderiales bacterium]